MKFINFNKVMCLSPHPDDVEYSMMGTILKHKETKFDILCMTSGGKHDKTCEGNIRLKEVAKVWQSADIKNAQVYFTQFMHFSDIPEETWINFIEKYFLKNFKYDALLIPSVADSHFEHRFVSGFGAALCRDSDMSLVEYCTPSALQTWIPNFYVDIAKNYETKKNLLKYFVSQNKKEYFSDYTLNGFHTDFQCSKKNLKIVEKFRIINLYSK